jgi:hypothetical protein
MVISPFHFELSGDVSISFFDARFFSFQRFQVPQSARFLSKGVVDA